MSERIESKRCIKALYKYSSFPDDGTRPARVAQELQRYGAKSSTCFEITWL